MGARCRRYGPMALADVASTEKTPGVRAILLACSSKLAACFTPLCAARGHHSSHSRRGLKASIHRTLPLVFSSTCKHHGTRMPTLYAFLIGGRDGHGCSQSAPTSGSRCSFPLAPHGLCCH